MKRKKRERLIRRMRRAHITGLSKHSATVAKMRASLVAGMGGVGVSSSTRFKGHTKPSKPGLKGLRTYVSPGWAHVSVAKRDRCKHKRKVKISKHWRQCKKCKLCFPRLGKPPKFLRLPPILKDVILPSRHSEEDSRIDLRNTYTVAGVVLSKFIRATVIQYTWKSEPEIDRISIEMKFGKLGWKSIAVVYETHWYKILPMLQAANPKKPKSLFRKLQIKLGTHWPEPWLKAPWRRKGSWRLYWDKSTIARVVNGTVSYSKAKTA